MTRSRRKAERGSRLSRLRQEAHQAFDVYWQLGGLKRSAAYKWLASQMNMKEEDCHMGMMNEFECECVIEICRTIKPAKSARRRKTANATI